MGNLLWKGEREADGCREVINVKENIDHTPSCYLLWHTDTNSKNVFINLR